MSNLKSARQAIQAELEHARQGMAFYQSRVEALEDALSKLESVEGPAGAPAPARRGRKPHARPAQKPPAGEAALPATGKDFWPSLITTQPQSAPEILKAAVQTLGITPSREQLRKLAQRQTSALHNLVKAKRIEDSGSGRERRFFKRQ